MKDAVYAKVFSEAYVISRPKSVAEIPSTGSGCHILWSNIMALRGPVMELGNLTSRQNSVLISLSNITLILHESDDLRNVPHHSH